MRQSKLTQIPSRRATKCAEPEPRSLDGWNKMRYQCRVVLLVVGTLLAAVSANADTLVLEAESCAVALTASGQGSWRSSFVYTAAVDATGRAGPMTLAPTDTVAAAKKFIRLNQFEACIQRWRFAGPGALQIVFDAGTSGETLRRWLITVTRAGEQFRLVLPR